jgi:nucleoside-diphosphate-sugar epimerase
VRDTHFCKEIVKGTDVVFHLAALVAIQYSYAAHNSYSDMNVKGTLKMKTRNPKPGT